MVGRAYTARQRRHRGPAGRGGRGSGVSMGICCGCLPPQDVNQDEEEVPVHLEAISEEAEESFTAEESRSSSSSSSAQSALLQRVMWKSQGYSEYTLYPGQPFCSVTDSHNQRTTAFRHPVTGQISPENTDFFVQELGNSHMSKLPSELRPPSMVSESSVAVTSSTVDAPSGLKWTSSQLWKKRSLHQEEPQRPCSGERMALQADSREETVLGSIPLPSYVISPVEPEDHISRKFAFKASHTGMRSYIYSKNSVIGSQAEHGGMRTYYFSADTQEDMNGWIRAMNKAALMQSHSLKRVGGGSRARAQTSRSTRHTGDPGFKAVYAADGDANGVSLDLELCLEPPCPSEKRRTQRAERRRSVSEGSPVIRADRKTRAEEDEETLAQVEHWVKVQKGEPKSHVSEFPLPRCTPPLQPKLLMTESYQSLPKSSLAVRPPARPGAPDLPSDYKYAHDRLSHFRMSTDERMAAKEGMVWQLYEWQQRQRFRHGGSVVPSVLTVPDYVDASSFRNDAGSLAGSCLLHM
ncbi:Pleckstrin homology domain-containing family A member 7 [Bagarius yarrelli]|uniref:Pleckstrin homology domain-containing family A member 7 n=1 Tax=Bagarius yarrelli TaxID=175774 RepID=A0A556VUP5_BAGYA|nr:Pleckstrin homology domain-containing family A member 7 [Bagarius yarrelli]